MRISIGMGPEFARTSQSLRSLGAQIVRAADRGLLAGGKQATGHIAANKLSGQELARRTGNLARDLDAWRAAPYDVEIGIREKSRSNKYAWLLGDEQHVITPKRAKFLAIPIGEAKTAAGVARYEGPRDAAARLGNTFFVRSGGKLLFGYKVGKKGKFRPLFVLVKSVLVQGTGALIDGVEESMDTIREEVDAEIRRVPGVES